MMNTDNLDHQAIIEAVIAWLPEWRIDYLARKWEGRYEIIGEGNKRFTIVTDWYHAKNKLHISGLSHSINVSPTRTAQSIANEIKRRFLPTFLEQHEEKLKQEAESKAKKENIEIIKAMFKRVFIVPQESSYSRYDFKLEEGSLQLNRNLTIEYCDYKQNTCEITIETNVNDAAIIIAAINQLKD